MTPTTEKTVESFLRALAGTGDRYALLDGSPNGWRSPESDLDLVSSRSLARILPDILPPLIEAGVYPVMVVRYDVDRGDAMWLVGAEDDVIQVDVLSDPRGVNRLAFSTDTALASTRTPEDGIPRVSTEIEIAYRVAKNLSRRRFDRLRQLDITGLDRAELATALRGIYGARWELGIAALEQMNWASVRRRLQRSKLLTRFRRGGPPILAAVAARLLNRVIHPVGLWLHFRGTAGGGAAALTWSALGTGFARRNRLDWDEASLVDRIRVRATIRRPSLVVSSGRGRRPRAALVVDVGDELPAWQDLRQEVLSLAATRTLQRSR